MLRISKNAAPLTRQRGVFRVSRCLYEVIVGQRVRDAVDRARTLIQGGELAAVLPDAIVDIFDARDRRVVVRGRRGGVRIGSRCFAECWAGRGAGAAESDGPHQHEYWGHWA